MKSRIAAALLACALALAPASAQDRPPEGEVQEIELVDGSRIYGRIVEERGDRVVVETVGGVRMELARAQLRSTRTVTGRVVDGALWPRDPHATRLFFSPTARAVPQGEGYFGVFELFLPFLSYGVTDRFTISGGTPIIPEVIGRVFYLAPKVEVVRTSTFSGAIGTLAFFGTEAVGEGTFGLLYAVGTVGDPDRALTLGATVPFYATDGASDIGNDLAFMIGGEARLSRRTKFITENLFILGGDGALLSGGVRFFGERLSADFGLAGGLGSEDGFCCIPLVNFVYSFGGGR